METFSQRESILLGYNPQSQRSSTNPSTAQRDSDVDFHDVFGGPPRRSSIQEMRHRLGELADFSGSQTEEEGGSGSGSGSGAWPSAVREKPVFGEDNLNRRRYPNDNFYDDIFGGDEPSPSCTPRKHERYPFSAAPDSRIMSPLLPLPPGPDFFAPSSPPSTLSLPAKMTKGMDLPTFGSPARSLRKNIRDSAANGQSSSDSPATHLSRFSSHATHATQVKEDLKNGSRTYRQSLLSQEFSDLSISDKADKGGDGAGHFHFSIYKWASKGVVPLVMPLRAERNLRTKENFKLERSLSSKDWIVRESTSQYGSSSVYPGSSLTNNRKQVGSTTFTSPQKGADSRKFVEVIKDVPGSALSCDTQAESRIYSASEIGFSGKMKGDSVYGYTNETHKPESKPLHSLFSKSDDYDEKTKWEKGKEIKTKKGEKKTVALKNVEVTKATSQGSLSLDENMGNVGVKGKVKEFVRIFSQKALTKPRVDAKSRIQVEDNSEHSKKEDSATETTNISRDNLSRQDDISGSAIPDSTVADKDGFYQENFLVKELAQDENEVLQTQDNQEIKVIDHKIRQWSNGKEGNIRSLLSTLQYVLWPESGWKPVPLVDIIEGNAVKRAYQRALLCLHPDKLQQKGAASHQKYIAEKVFDILQEAWTHFNMLGAL